jgi:hypothetical protein
MYEAAPSPTPEPPNAAALSKWLGTTLKPFLTLSNPPSEVKASGPAQVAAGYLVYNPDES